MTVEVGQQLLDMARDIDAAVSSSRSRTVSIPTADAQAFGNAALADWVDAAREGVQDAIRGLAAEAGARADGLRDTVAGFNDTDGDVVSDLAGITTHGSVPR